VATRVFVNIDDAGVSDHVNQALKACVEVEVADGTSLLATGPRLEEAIRLVQSSRLEPAVHLDALRGPFLVKGSGFPGSPLLWASGFGSPRLLEREWRAQIERLLEAGLEIRRMDSHRHVHHLPRLRGLFLGLASEYGIEEIRAARLPDRSLRSAGHILNALGRKLARMANEAGMHTSSCIIGFGRSGMIDRDYLEAISSSLPEGPAELVAHPSTRPEWSEGQPRELELLLSDWFTDWRRGLEADAP
jgi:predicted glycoside hydrolase/deacetylase ChbG (UPF0249 family)